MNLVLLRDTALPTCTLGVLSVEAQTFQTLECPWVPGPPGGTPGVSCVPVGTYQLIQHDTEAHPRSFALVNPDLHVYHLQVPAGLPGRATCLIHIANYVSELRGCIALGMERREVGTQWELNHSRIAVNRFYTLVPWTVGHTLEIR